LIGAGGEKVALGMVARHAQMGNWPGTPEVIRTKITRLNEHSQRIGRDAATIEKSVLVDHTFPIENVRREIDAYLDAGVSHIIFSIGPGDRAWMHDFAEKNRSRLSNLAGSHLPIGFEDVAAPRHVTLVGCATPPMTPVAIRSVFPLRKLVAS
jgi:hypothetical protein